MKDSTKFICTIILACLSMSISSRIYIRKPAGLKKKIVNEVGEQGSNSITPRND